MRQRRCGVVDRPRGGRLATSSWLFREVDTAGEFRIGLIERPPNVSEPPSRLGLRPPPTPFRAAPYHDREFASSIEVGEAGNWWENPPSVDHNPSGVATPFHQDCGRAKTYDRNP